MVHLNTFLFIGILMAAFTLGFIVLGILASGAKADMAAELDTLTTGFIDMQMEKEKLEKQVEFYKRRENQLQTQIQE